MCTFKSNTPCSTCPYRKDAKLKHWDKAEFKDLLKNENSQLGAVYGCHKQNGDICVGWLMMQDKNNFPSIMLRIQLSKQNVTREYLNSLKCKSELFSTTKEMVKANYKQLK